MSEDQNRAEEISEEVAEVKADVEEKLDEAKDDVAEKAAEVKADVEEKAAEISDAAAEVVADVKEKAAEDVEDKLDETKDAAHEAVVAAEDAIEGVVAADDSQEGKDAPRQMSQRAWIGIVCVALAVGLLIGAFVAGRWSSAFFGGGVTGKTSLTEKELDAPVATLTYDGSMQTFTARFVFEQSGSLDSVKNEDGSYPIPAADKILSLARSTILTREAETMGITATDEDVKAYAEEQLGGSDFAAMAEQYQMDESTVVALLRNSTVTDKLHKKIVGEEDAGAMPESPAEPAEGADKAAPTKEYADYIIGLAADEWDASKGTWKATDGPYATALANFEVKPDGATYEAAQAAYYVAYQNYSQKASETAKKWNDYLNGIFSNARIEISTLVGQGN